MIDLAQATNPTTRARVLVLRSKFYAQNRKQDLAFRDLKEALSLAPGNADIAVAIRSLQNLSMSDSTDDPSELMEQFVKGDKSAGEKLANSMSSESFARSFIEADLLSRLLKTASKDHSTCGRILLRLSINDIKEVSTQLIQTVSADKEDLFLDCGSDGVEALTNIILRKWDDDKQRQATLQSFITKLA